MNKQEVINQLRKENKQLYARLCNIQYCFLPKAKKSLLEDVCLTAHAIYDLDQEEVNATTIVGAKHYLDCAKYLCDMYEIVAKINNNRKLIKKLSEEIKHETN